jgi:hypothetical protein
MNRLRLGNTALQVLLAVLLLGGLNYLGSHYYERWDWTEDRRFSLSPETRARLAQLTEPVEILVVLPSEGGGAPTERLLRDLRRLLGNFQRVAREEGNPNLSVEFIDLYKDRQRARAILGRYGVSTPESILVVSGSRLRQIPPHALYERAEGRLRAFRGEAAVLTALLEVTRPEDEVLYFLTGHGEYPLESVSPVEGLSRLSTFLRSRGFAVETLSLGERVAVPEDAGAVFLVGPLTRFPPRERRLLREYLEARDGRLLAFLRPEGETGLGPLFRDWGIRVGEGIVVDRGTDSRTVAGDLLVRTFGAHPVTRSLGDLGLTLLLGVSRPVAADPQLAPDPGTLAVEELLFSSQRSWAERDLRPGVRLHFEEGVDRPGPVPLAVAARRQSENRFRIDLDASLGGRLAVFGDAGFLANERLEAAGNRLLVLGLLDWALERSEELNVPAKAVRSYLVVLSDEELRQLLPMLALPASLLTMAGILVALVRR